MTTLHSPASAQFVSSFYRGTYPAHVANVDLLRADKLMKSYPGLTRILNQNQWDAVASLVLSVLQGEAQHPYEQELFGCTLFKNLTERKFQLALADMAEYVYFQGHYSPHLEARRRQEVKLFLTPTKPEV